MSLAFSSYSIKPNGNNPPDRMRIYSDAGKADHDTLALRALGGYRSVRLFEREVSAGGGRVKVYVLCAWKR